MDFWTPRHFQSITGGRWLIEPTEKPQQLKGFSIDSRHIDPAQIFVAIRGENHDGHDHVASAIGQGAAMVIVEREISDFGFRISDLKASPDYHSSNPKSEIPNPTSPPPVLLVSDTVLALQQLAAAWRDELRNHHVKVIAVTGSNGKTTTRHMIHAALSSTLRGTQSPKSFNNHLGVPLTLLAASTADDFLVAEVGTNHPGEIASLAKILRPDIAVITNIGTAHIGMFGSKDAIAAEKSSLFHELEPGGIAVINGTQPYVAPWRQSAVPQGRRIITFGQNSECDIRTDARTTADVRGLQFTINGGQMVQLPLLGAHNIDNALAALAVTRAMRIEDATAAKALAVSTGVEMRMQIIRLGERDSTGTTGERRGITIIQDAYNANPDSMFAALTTLATLDTVPTRSATRRIAILGDMRELGDESAAEHRHLGDILCILNQLPPKPPGPSANSAGRAAIEPTKIHRAILIGQEMRFAADQLAGVWPEGTFHYFDRWTDELPAIIARLLHEGDLILLKASRGLRFERLMPAIEKRFQHAPDRNPQTITH